MADHALATVDNPSSALTDFTLIVDLSDMPADWWTAVNTSDGTRGRVYKGDGSTRLACDWIDFDDTDETGLLRVLWSGTLATTGTQELWIEPPVSGNATVAADNTYGSDNAYPSTVLGYYSDGGTTDRTSNSNDGTAFGSPSEGGATGQLGGATSFNGSSQYIEYPWQLDGETEISFLAAYNPGETTALDPLFSRYSCYSGHWQFNAALGSFYTRDTSTRVTGARNNDISWTAKATGSWYNYAAIYDSTGGSKKVRIDESDMASSTTSVDAMTTIDSYNTLAANKKKPSTEPIIVSYTDVTAQHVWFFLDVLSDAWVDHEGSQLSDNATFWGTWSWESAGGTTAPTAVLSGPFGGPLVGCF